MVAESLHEPMIAVHVEDLTVSYHGKPVLWDIDVNIPPGVMAAVVGPNGAGKSTLIKAILGGSAMSHSGRASTGTSRRPRSTL